MTLADSTEATRAEVTEAEAAQPAVALASGPVTMYTTPWCGYCRRLKRQLRDAAVDFVEVDIERHPEAAQLVMSVNRGDQTVPTVLLPDGTALTNPPIKEIIDALKDQRNESS